VHRHVTPFALAALVLAMGSVAADPAVAQPISRQDVPPDLRPWVPWVLDEVPQLGCPRVQGRAVCVWPGRLRLDLSGSGGTFDLRVHADRDADLLLPGTAQHWPLDVRLDGRAVAVYGKGGTPRLRIPSGRHLVAGRFVWSRLPESLAVPATIGLVELGLDGRPVPRPRREDGGLLWLRARVDEAAGEGESLRLQVFRHVADGIPLFVETRLQLEVSGRAREVRFPAALLPDSVAVAVSGDLPARVEDRVLRVQVRGGRYAVRVLARIEGRPDALARPSPDEAAEGEPGTEAWPEREVWVFATNEELRQVELSGPPAIDPSRTELPADWRTLPAFLVEPGGSLAIATVRRGQPEAPPDALQLSREIWLDPDGHGASVRDSFGGTLHARTRLDLLPPGALGRVAVDGQDQLVTANPQTDDAGVELRRSALQMVADSRLTLGGALPAVGWSTGVEQLHARLHLPPGWTILAARGVDQLRGTWTSRWTLLGFFFVLLVAFGAYRLFGPRHAALAVATLVLTYGEPGAPFYVWLSLLGAIALRRVAPTGRLGSLGRIWFLVSAAMLVLLLVPFARDQVRDALFPQVARGGAQYGLGRGGFADNLTAAQAPRARTSGVAGGVPGGVVGGVVGGTVAEEGAADKAAAFEAPIAASAEQLEKEMAQAPAEQRLPSSVAPRYAYNVALEQDPKAVLQTGPGVPSWTWGEYSLSWTGPVGQDHRMRLVLASPGLNRLLAALRLVLLGLFAAVLLTGRWPRLPGRAAGAAPAAGVLAGILLLTAPGARAAEPQTPSPQILEKLKQKLTRPEPCEPACLTTPDLRLQLGPRTLEISAEVHAAADGAWAVPGPLASWAASDVRVDGASTTAVALLADGFLRVRLPPGVHRIVASGPVPPGDSFTLQFAEPPRRARAVAPGWEVSGLRVDGPPEASILLSRRLAAGAAGEAVEGRYAPWLEVTRTLGFGVTWTVTTRVRRVTPLGTPVALRVPLLPAEAPTRADFVVEGGEAAVSLGRDETQTSWQSTLEQAGEITLEAPEGRPWSEVWRLQCSAVWSCTAQGLPPVERIAGGVLAPEYRPWPGESLQVALAHPPGIEGQTLTLDSVSLEATPGTRIESLRLQIRARSSREQPLRLGLPEESEVQQVLLDGRERPMRPDEGELRVTVPAGTHDVAVRWQQPRGMGAVYSIPRVGLPGPAVNVTQNLTLPPSRWLLVTRGPAWGPAVLFWPYFVFLLAVAFALGRISRSPLTSTQWVLLGLGLSQIPALGALVVAAFVFALALRRERQPEGAFLFDLTQLLLVVWAVVSLVLLYSAIHTGLLFRPDMQVAGNGSTDTALRWYADRVAGETPGAGVVSLPLWVYRVGMLVWALWLAAGLVRAIGWGWRAFGEGGFWRRLIRRRTPLAPAAEGGADDTPKE
jgi:hypothetical protein